MIQLNLFLSWQIKGTNRYYKNVDLVDFIDYLVNGTGRVSGNKYSTTRKSSLSFNLTQPPGSHHFPDFLSAFLPSNLSSTLQLSKQQPTLQRTLLMLLKTYVLFIYSQKNISTIIFVYPNHKQKRLLFDMNPHFLSIIFYFLIN